MAEMEVDEEEEELLVKLADACADDVVDDDADVDAEEGGVMDIEEGEEAMVAGEAAASVAAAAVVAAAAAAASVGCVAADCGRGLRAAVGSDSSGIVIQGWRRSSSMRMRSPGLILRHRLIRSWHSGVRRVRNLISAEQICSSCSKGMSPQTMS